MTNAAPLNRIPNEPTLKDLMDLSKKDVLLNLSCHHVGTVQSFDASRQVATATINYKKTFYEQDQDGTYHPVLVDYPILIDCPVIVLGGAGGALTFPIAKGDECLVLFNDRDIDTWFQGASGRGVATSRLHSFSDGLILVGVRSLANVLEDYDSARAVLRNGDALVGVGETLIKIANATTSLNALLQDLISAIRGITTLNSDSTTGVVSAASKSALSGVASQIAGLLE